MAAMYDTIAAEYQKAKQAPWRLHIEHFTLFELLGDITGKAVLDLACGEGYHTRALKRAGASRVVGVDVSPKMIELARQEEARQPLGIDYLVQDAGQLDLKERFDIVTATYLFNYARTPEELRAMCRGVAGVLKPGGRMVAVNDNIFQTPDTYATGKTYGAVKSINGELREGTTITITFSVDGQEFHIENYHASPATFDAAFREAGLKNLRWHQPRVSPEGIAKFGAAYWQEFLDHPGVIFLDCTR